MKRLKSLVFFETLVLVVSSCSFIQKYTGKGGGAPTAENPGEFSTATGLRYNDDEKPSFQVTAFEGQPDAPNMRFIEGGRAVMGCPSNAVT